MHSRKSRIGDGYYESPSRSYANYNKYNSSRNSSYSRDRGTSPTAKAYRSVSPEGGSPRERQQGSTSSRNKDREREYIKRDKYSDKRGRYRDVDHRNYHKRAKLREVSRSEEDHKNTDRSYDTKERDSKFSRYSDRDHANSKMIPAEKVQFGDWIEQISSNGTKYYFNERLNRKQWEKPVEWVQYDRRKESYENSDRDYREKDRERRKNHDDRFNNAGSSRRPYNSSKHSRSNSRVRWPHDSDNIQPSTSSSSVHHKRYDENADMEISSDSTPTSEPSYSPSASNQHVHNSRINNSISVNHDDSIASPLIHATKHLQPVTNSNQLHHQMSNASSTSTNSSSKNNVISSSIKIATASVSPSNHLHHHPLNHHSRNRSASPTDFSASLYIANNVHHNSSSVKSSPAYVGPSNNNNNNVTTSTGGLNSSRLELISANSNSNHIGDDPPTPEMDLDTNDHRRPETTSGVSSLQGVMSISQVTNRFNLLTPSLEKFYRSDLIQHVLNWQSDILEKQAQKCCEEVYMLGDLECSKISAEIKCARSTVRVAEIAATIQEQRKLFLHDQIQSLESQTENSSMISI